MGGLFRAPKPVIVQVPVPAPVTAAPAVVPAASVDPAKPDPVSPVAEQAASDARVAAQSRTTRGMPGTIVTSARGVLQDWALLPGLSRKSLLGE